MVVVGVSVGLKSPLPNSSPLLSLSLSSSFSSSLVTPSVVGVAVLVGTRARVIVRLAATTSTMRVDAVLAAGAAVVEVENVVVPILLFARSSSPVAMPKSSLAPLLPESPLPLPLLPIS